MNPYPKAFRVSIKSANNGAELDVDKDSIITIVNVEEEGEVWKIWAETQGGSMTNASIDRYVIYCVKGEGLTRLNNYRSIIFRKLSNVYSFDKIVFR